ncbi:MAG: aminoglycoside phosphotransferase family protein [Thermoprotei archaeon]|nr:MAG: aminoglycoside phosphotransferase family protein [Thermoprotei archaeon]RLF25181.1 MAG: aminoglycoside phosphotransferase family protein [Thermoprotei archaeon]
MTALPIHEVESLNLTIAGIPIPLARIEAYLKKLFKTDDLKVFDIRLLGSGWHAEAWIIDLRVKGERKRLVLKFLKGEKGFGHDYPADRAQVLLMAHKDFNKMKGHVRSVDVGYISRDGELISAGNYEEFFILMEEAKGTPYIEDLQAILKRGHLTDKDLKRMGILVEFLVELHQMKFTGSIEDRARLYLRRVRDLVGHGEMIFGVVDSAYPLGGEYDVKLKEIEKLALEWRWKLRTKHHRLAQVHGDYHPFNIRFTENDELVLMDRSRGEWGEPADDVSCLTINYLWHALLHRSGFEGPFKDLFIRFIELYLEMTNDEELLKVIQPWYAFRSIVIASPLFYPENPPVVRTKLLNFAKNILQTEIFEPKEVDDLLRD